MTDKERLEVIKHSYEVLQGLSKEVTEKISDAQDGIKEDNRDLIMGSLYGLDEAAERIKNVYAVMMFLHQRSR